ncbi:MAG: hypothetical protein Q7S51_01535 [Gallionellaceae bacterium]|nr:hypothetical protein [Gallionellaceae bacterium]
MEINFPVKADPRADLLVQGRLHHPYDYLGLHHEMQDYVVRIFNPWASEISLQMSKATFRCNATNNGPYI